MTTLHIVKQKIMEVEKLLAEIENRGDIPFDLYMKIQRSLANARKNCYIGTTTISVGVDIDGNEV